MSLNTGITAFLGGRSRGLRNRIVHDYFGLDVEIIWQVLEVSLRQFKQQLQDVKG
jgi:uncharacterized protein with HEPN domain